MSERLALALESLNTEYEPIKPSLRLSRRISRLTKSPRNREVDSNKTVKFFRSISRRRLRSSRAVPEQVESLFSPFDRERLLDRIATFQSVIHWNVVSDVLTPLRASLAGWRCDTKKVNTVMCICCNARFSVKLPLVKYTEDGDESTTENELTDKVAERYVEKLPQFHRCNCPWRKQCTPISLYQISFSNMTNELQWFKERYEHNISFSDHRIEIESVLDEEALGMIRPYITEHGLLPNDEIIEISLLGWEFEQQGTSLLLSSRSDARRLISIGRVNLLHEHHNWSCFTSGYLVLLDIFRSLSSTPETGESSTDRLSRLRQLYFG